jgi:hypothetical protein
MTEERLTNEQLAQSVGSAIVGVLKEAENYSGSQRSRMVLDAALAYRALRGGPQPGGFGPAQ